MYGYTGNQTGQQQQHQTAQIQPPPYTPSTSNTANESNITPQQQQAIKNWIEEVLTRILCLLMIHYMYAMYCRSIVLTPGLIEAPGEARSTMWEVGVGLDRLSLPVPSLAGRIRDFREDTSKTLSELLTTSASLVKSAVGHLM